MPVVDDPIKSSWAADDEFEDLPPPVTKIEGNNKTITEYSYNDDDKKIKIVSYFKIEKHRVSKSIAQRKAWKKYGLSSRDPAGPNTATTITGEDINMQFVSSKEEEVSEQDELKKKLMDTKKGQVQCRLCKEDHWTLQCPYKDKLEPLRSSLLGEEKEEEPAPGQPGPAAAPEKGKYVPPNMREGAAKRGETMNSGRRDDKTTIRVTNLAETAT